MRPHTIGQAVDEFDRGLAGDVDDEARVFARYDIVTESDLESALGQLATGTQKGHTRRSGRVAQFTRRRR